MGRTAIAFLVLVAVGGCVTDDQGPAASALGNPKGQPFLGAAPTYATWTRTNQFAMKQDAGGATPPPQVATVAVAAPVHASVPVPVPVPVATTSTLKPTAPHKPAADLTLAPGQGVAPTAPTVDPDLVTATLVQTVGNAEPVAHEIPSASRPNGSNADVALATAKALPAGTRMVNCKRIMLNYELRDVGASGVAGVELWCTQDAHTWKRGEIVAETNHSFTVDVKDQGLYGFTLVARNGSGVGMGPPQSGQQPQVWVSVDVTKPVVQIVGLEVTQSGKAPTLMIHWTAKHKTLGPRPIHLAYAEEVDGPWTPIAANLENNGQYEWQPTNTLPHHLYFRVEAADQHGNVGAAQTANPLRIDGAVPSNALSQAEAAGPHKPLPPPPALDASRPTAAILGVEPSSN